MSFFVANSTLGLDVGLGLFASRAYKRGERIVEYRGELLTKEQYDARYADKLGKYVLQLSADKYLDARDPLTSGPARYVNDCRRCDKEEGSCPGNNVEARVAGNRAFIFATRAIQPGEEFFWNYGRAYWK